jgi:hypothetical protein
MICISASIDGSHFGSTGSVVSIPILQALGSALHFIAE